MKFILALIIPFLISINLISDKDIDRVKCCGGEVTERDSYLEDGYEYKKGYNLNMSFSWNKQTGKYGIRRDKIEYTMVGEEGVSMKYITQIKHGKLDNLSFKVLNSRRKAIEMETRELSEKIRETKFTFPEK